MKSDVSLRRRGRASRLALLSIASLAASCAANAQETPSVWQKHPSTEDLITFYPEVARAADAAGKVRMRCGMNPNGTLGACSILDEQPMGQGFGDAALKLSRLYRAFPNTNAAPVDIVIEFPRPSGARR